MNNTRRKLILHVIDHLNAVLTDLMYITDEEQESYENLPESLQYSSKGESMEEWIDLLEYQQSNIQDVIDELDSKLNE